MILLPSRSRPCWNPVSPPRPGAGIEPVASREVSEWLASDRFTIDSTRKGAKLIKSPGQRPPIAFADYCRICNVIFSVIEDHTDTHHACICFAMIGAHLLREHYKLNADAVSGAAAYALGQQYKVLTFGRIENGRLVAAPDAFHCWVECKGYVLDFLAPLFPDNLAEDRDNVELPTRRVWMKPLAEMSPALPQRNSAAGTFQLVPSFACKESMIRNFFKTPMSGDLREICTQWYRRPPKTMQAELTIRDDRFNITQLKLKALAIRGFW